MKEKIIKIVKKCAILSIVSLIILLFVALLSFAKYSKSQYLENLDYDVIAYENGDAKVVETWDIDIKKTNTLFKTFKLNPYKYSGITDVQVVDITNNQYVPLTQINEEMYHVTTGCYYGLKINSSEFEIAWGTGMEEKSGKKKYQISYVIKDAITDYKDCQELYWQFLAQGENKIPARKVTGTITFPKDVKNIEELRVWGHGQLNGEINKVNNHQVKFSLDGLSSDSRLEIRVLTQEKMFNISNSNKIKNYAGLKNIIDEETEWANGANQIKRIINIFKLIAIIIYLIVIIIYIIKILKIKKYEKINILEGEELLYFRDIPRENDATPAEAVYLYKFEKTRLNTKKVQEEAVASTILDLCLRKKISLRTDDKSNVYIKIIGDASGLKSDELEIYKLLKNVGGSKEFEIGQLQKYANYNYYEYSNRINNLVNNARNNLYKLGLIDKAEEKIYKKTENARIKFSMLLNSYLIALIMQIFAIIPFFKIKIDLMFGMDTVRIIVTSLILLLPFVGELLYYFILQERLRNKIAVLTEKGMNEKKQWKALRNYMKDFSNFKEKTVPDLILWEKYLVFATALGIGATVAKQMKALYPEVFVEEYWEKEDIKNLYPILDFAMNPYYEVRTSSPISKIGKDVSNAYNISQTEIIRHSSSSSRRAAGRSVASLEEVGRTVADGRTEWVADRNNN